MYTKESSSSKCAALIAAVLLSGAALCFAEQGETNSPQKLFDMPLEELVEVSIVTSASRQPQKIGHLTVPVTIITAEDIHYSGLTSIAEVLLFAPGVDILKIDRLSYAVGIHGLHEMLSDRTTLLIDGRPTDNTVYGGVDFLGLPLMLEDIERIEIIRSPESASWGANALTGIINIVTKKPQDVQGTFGSTTFSEFGDSYNHLRVAKKEDKWSWRVSGGYQNIESSDDAMDRTAEYKSFQPALNSLMGFSNFHARDFARVSRFDSDAEYAESDETKLRLGLGYSNVVSGDTEITGYYPMKNIREDHVRSFARLEHKFDDGASAHLQWSGKFWNANWPNISQFNTAENKFETQFNFPLTDNHLLSVGADFKWDHIYMSRDNPEQVYVRGAPFDDYTTGAFVIDRLQLTDRLTLEGQFRVENYSPANSDWAGRLSALYALDSQHNHTLRFSVAKAFRAPLTTMRKFYASRYEIAPDVYLNNLRPPDNLENEETTSLEAGYWGKLSDKFIVEADAYYQRFEKLIGTRATTNMLGQMFVYPANIDGADSWGAELQLTYKDKSKALSAWYSYNGFKCDTPAQDLQAFLPSPHKAGLTGRLFLSDDWVINSQYRFADTTLGNPANGRSFASSNRLDLTISKSFARDKCEIMIGVQDIFDKTHAPIAESFQFTGHEIPGRTFFVRLQFSF
jgi:iron complex outermembrane receptor protein